MKQELIVDTKKRKMFVKENGKVVKIIKNVRFGKNGVCSAEEMIEGGKRTPFGTYKLGISFGTHNIDIDYPYIKIDDNCYWVDDSNSPYYNCLVSKDKIDEYDYDYIYSYTIDFTSAEHLVDYKIQYEYAIFIEYNTERKKDKGSAIFLHCTNGPYTLGCISVAKTDMKWLLYFIDREKNPIIKII